MHRTDPPFARPSPWRRQCAALPAIALLASTLTLLPGVARAFTQSGVGTIIANAVPMGHEWVTRLAALELVGGDPVAKPDPLDPRRTWTQGKAKNLDLSSAGAQGELKRIRRQAYRDKRYESTYKPVYDAIVGERWVDIGGYNVTSSQNPLNLNCWDAVAQEPADVQYDHFMRRYDDRGGDGGVQAARRSRERFIEYFVNAAMAPTTLMVVWDGGGYSARTEVDRNYFLFGRAAHLFEDSFSSEHTVRIAADNYESVRQVKSYLCAAGSEQHTHSTAETAEYASGDVIWKRGTQFDPTWNSYKPSNMTTLALVATEASKDLWAAFIRSMGAPLAQRQAVARAEAEKLAENWLSSDDAEMRDWYTNPVHRREGYVREANKDLPGQSVSECMQGLGVQSGEQAEKVRELERTQRICLYNAKAVDGYADLWDTSLRMPYNWAWKDTLKWQQPPSDWKIPERPADTGTRVRIRSRLNGQYMTAPDGIRNDAWIYARAGAQPLEFIRVGPASNAYYRLSDANLFLSYRFSTGAVKLYKSPLQANYAVKRVGDAFAIENLFWKHFMWLYKESPYITRKGDPGKRNAQWLIESRQADAP